jgi:hypothetical protein
VHAVSCELVSCFPVFQGKNRELCWPNLAGSRRRPPKCEYLKQLMAKFPAVNNREFVNADQGINSGDQGRPLNSVGRRLIRPGASCRTSPTRPRSGARSLLEPMGEPQGGTTKTLFWRQALLSPAEPDEPSRWFWQVWRRPAGSGAGGEIFVQRDALRSSWAAPSY